jgi:hypothetical protein
MLNLVRGVVETDALASAIADKALKRAADSAVLACRWLEEDDNPLNETQVTMLHHVMLRCFDGLTAEVQAEIECGIRRDA